jgi:manganese efflux pump family protein
MELMTSFIIALGLAMDVFAVSLGIGTSGRANSFRPAFRISFHAGLFQGLMTVLGWLAGSTVANLISGVDHWIALILLAFVGIRMVRSGLDQAVETHSEDPTRGKTLMMVCVATSIDAMAVGLSLAMLKVDILLASIIIGVTSLVLSIVGLLAGTALGQKFGKQMETMGGIILIGIGIRVVLSHLS